MNAKTSGGGGSRALWTIVDQALSSLSTAAMSIAIAKVSSDRDFGRFSLAFVVYTFMIGVSRALASTPFILGHTGDSEEDVRDRGSESVGLSIVLGLVGGGLVVILALLFGGRYRDPLITVGLFMAVLLMQDTWRMLLIAVGRPRSATLQDSLVVALQIASFAACILTGHKDPVTLICAWAVPTGLAGCIGVWQWGAMPALRQGWVFLGRHWTISRFLFAEFLAVQGASQLAWFVIPILGTPQDVGALRGGMTLLGTLNIIGNSVYMFALSEVLRRRITAPGALLRVGMVVTGSIALVDVVVGGILVVLPDSLGSMLLGATWATAAVTMLPLTVYMVGVAFSTGPQTVMRSRADTRGTFRVNLVLGPVLLACVCVGQYLWAAEGAAWGFAAATVGTAPLWWWMAHRAVHRPRRVAAS